MPPVACFDECQFLLREGNSGDFFSSETPVILSMVCISSLKQQVSKVCPGAVSLLLESARYPPLLFSAGKFGIIIIFSPRFFVKFGGTSSIVNK